MNQADGQGGYSLPRFAAGGGYDLRAAVPDAQKHFDRYRTRSSEFRSHRPPDHADQRYGPRPRNRFDVWVSSRRAPLFVFVHGGYWFSFEKEVFDYLAAPFLDAGVSVASVEYSLCPDVTIADQIFEVRRAVAAAGNTVDAPRLVLAGHSAGAHLAIMSAAAPAHEEGTKGNPDLVVGISGIYNLGPIRHTYVQQYVRVAATEVHALSPIHRPDALPGRLLLAVGELETEVFHDQQREFVAAAAHSGCDVTALTVAGRHHFDVIDTLGGAEPLYQQILKVLLE